MTDTCKAIIDLLGCECERIDAAAGGRAIYRRYKMLLRQGEAAGFTPLAVYVSDFLLEALLDNLSEASAQTCVEYRAKLLPLVEHIDVYALLQARFEGAAADIEPAELVGNFANIRHVEGEESLCMSCRGMAREVLIVKCPTQNPWELPLYLPMGGFNDCPLPAEQAAVFRFWQEVNGAVPVVVGYDIWELRVSNPPMQLLEAERLAMQHFAFDFERVLQAEKGQDSLRALASRLAGAKIWYFWWG